MCGGISSVSIITNILLILAVK